MLRYYTPKPGAKVYKHYTKSQLAQAVSAVQRGMSYRKAAVKYKILRSVINRRSTRVKVNKQGGQTVLGDDVEEMLVSHLKTCGQWGFPLDSIDLRMTVKGYLDRRGIVVKKFKTKSRASNGFNSFLRRQRALWCKKICQKIKRNCSAVSRETVAKYFHNLADSIKDVVPANIINYDETSLADNPGCKKVILTLSLLYAVQRTTCTGRASDPMPYGISQLYHCRSVAESRFPADWPMGDEGGHGVDDVTSLFNWWINWKHNILVKQHHYQSTILLCHANLTL